jgi:Ca-activated chloride channel family protein
MTFANPGALWLLLLLPVLLFGLGLSGWVAKKGIAELFQLNLRRLGRNHVKKYVMAAVLATLLIGALALPELPFSSFAIPGKTGEIILLVDVSVSMGAKKDPNDLNRLERVKPILYDIINRMEDLRGVRLSLHGFTSIARSHVPFVGQEDYGYLRESIKKVLDINSTPGQGSALGLPLINVAGKFSKEQKAKLVILFGDGETFLTTTTNWIDSSFPVATAIRRAREEGIKVITVGFGEREGAKIPLYNMDGAFSGEYVKVQGVDHVSHLKEEGLKEIASQTGGRYFSEKNLKGLIDLIKENLGSATAEEVVGTVKVHRSVAHWFVLVALLILVVFSRRHLLN